AQGHVHVYILEIVHARAANLDAFVFRFHSRYIYGYCKINGFFVKTRRRMRNKPAQSALL
ncbi:MAG: hypothetical protein K2L99_02915, partial [Muribaculaceae bacterium]|nr:hypothetical protein [Muribaculaceae bacterium]